LNWYKDLKYNYTLNPYTSSSFTLGIFLKITSQYASIFSIILQSQNRLIEQLSAEPISLY